MNRTAVQDILEDLENATPNQSNGDRSQLRHRLMVAMEQAPCSSEKTRLLNVLKDAGRLYDNADVGIALTDHTDVRFSLSTQETSRSDAISWYCRIWRARGPAPNRDRAWRGHSRAMALSAAWLALLYGIDSTEMAGQFGNQAVMALSALNATYMLSRDASQ